MTPAKRMHRGHQVSSTKQNQVSLSGQLVKAAENWEEGESWSWWPSQLCPLKRSSSDHSLLGRAWSSEDSGGHREAEATPSSPCYSSAFSLFGRSAVHTAFIGKHDGTKQDSVACETKASWTSSWSQASLTPGIFPNDL